MSLNRLSRILGRVAAVARRYDSSPLAVLKRILRLRLSRGLRFEEARFAGLLDPRLPADAEADFVLRREFLRSLRPFNVVLQDLVDDKIAFAAHAQSHGLPIPRTLALVAPPFAVDGQGCPLHDEDRWERWFRESVPAAFVVKPAGGMGGSQIDFYEKRGDEAWLSGRRLTACDLRRRLCLEAAYGRAIVQERITNDPILARLSGTQALQCTRLVTVTLRSGEVELLVAFQKLIVGQRQIDNFAGAETGNLVVSIDAKTGTLLEAFADGAPCPNHPDTRAVIAGFQLPHWATACALVRRAALLFRPLRAIGWDVALTADGPALVEGNSEWLAFGEQGLRYSRADLARLQQLL